MKASCYPPFWKSLVLSRCFFFPLSDFVLLSCVLGASRVEEGSPSHLCHKVGFSCLAARISGIPGEMLVMIALSVLHPAVEQGEDKGTSLSASCFSVP